MRRNVFDVNRERVYRDTGKIRGSERNGGSMESTKAAFYGPGIKQSGTFILALRQYACLCVRHQGFVTQTARYNWLLFFPENTTCGWGTCTADE